MVMRLSIYSIRMQGQNRWWNYSIGLNMEYTVDPSTHFDSAQGKVSVCGEFLSGSMQIQLLVAKVPSELADAGILADRGWFILLERSH